MLRREAVCSCGQLRVTTESDPLRISMCHCLACQRRTGSAFVGDTLRMLFAEAEADEITPAEAADRLVHRRLADAAG